MSEQEESIIAGRAPTDVAAERAAAAASKGGSAPSPSDGLDGKTKDELLEEVERREREEGVDLGVTSGATKAEILAALRAG